MRERGPLIYALAAVSRSYRSPSSLRFLDMLLQEGLSWRAGVIFVLWRRTLSWACFAGEMRDGWHCTLLHLHIMIHESHGLHAGAGTGGGVFP